MSDYITEDNILHILKFLPPKTLLRFRCVCNGWKQTIDSQFFIVEHLALQKPQLIVEYEDDVFLVLDPRKLPSLDTLICPSVDPTSETSRGPCETQICPVEGKPIRNHIIGTLHGIICLYNDYWCQFLLWNPWIRKFSTIPSAIGFDWVEYDGDGVGSCGAFWIDPSTKCFKILGFKLHLFKDDGDVYALYSSVNQEWKETPLGEIQYYHIHETTPPVVIEGVAHWRALYEFRNEGKMWIGIDVVFFDFELERFDTIEALSVQCGWDLPVICNWEGALSLVYMDPDKNCDVFSRKEDSLVCMFHISLVSGVGRILWAMEERPKNSRILATVNDELALFDSKRMMCYYLRSQLKDPNLFFVVNGFVESLLFPEVEA